MTSWVQVSNLVDWCFYPMVYPTWFIFYFTMVTSPVKPADMSLFTRFRLSSPAQPLCPRQGPSTSGIHFGTNPALETAKGILHSELYCMQWFVQYFLVHCCDLQIVMTNATSSCCILLGIGIIHGKHTSPPDWHCRCIWCVKTNSICFSWFQMSVYAILNVVCVCSILLFSLLLKHICCLLVIKSLSNSLCD